MTFRKLWWLLVPLAMIGCAGSQQAQKPTTAGGNSSLVDEGPASASGQGAPATAQSGATGAAGAAAAGQPATAQLVPFQGQGGFSVLMPPNPQQDDRTQETPGGPVQVHLAQAQDSAGKYLSTLSEFPKGSLDRIKSKDLLDSLQQATIQSMGGTLTNSHDIQVGGLPGREFTATDPEGSAVTARVFVGNSRVYTLAGTYPKGEMPGSIQQFLGSFQPPAVGGSGEAGGAATVGSATSTSGDTMGSGTSTDSAATTVPPEPTKKHTKRSHRSSTATESSAATSSGSR